MENEEELATLPSKGKLLWILFWESIKITSVVIGGGYVILAALEQTFVRKLRWMSDRDFLDMVAVSQMVPGAIACNAAIYIGWQLAGFLGAFCALIGTILPPTIIIISLAMCMEYVPLDNVFVAGAFRGVTACVVGLIGATAFKLGKKTIKSYFEIFISLGIFLAVIIWNINAGYLILSSIPFGIIYVMFKRHQQKKSKEV